MIHISTLGERIAAVRKAQVPKLNQAAFAETLGATRTKIAEYETGRVTPDASFQKLLCTTYHVSPRWLDTGEGEMLLEMPDDLHSLVERSLPTLSPFARRTIERMLAAPPEMWDMFERIMRDALDAAPGDIKTPDE